jgi:hypothetical protein
MAKNMSLRLIDREYVVYVMELVAAMLLLYKLAQDVKAKE